MQSWISKTIQFEDHLSESLIKNIKYNYFKVVAPKRGNFVPQGILPMLGDIFLLLSQMGEWYSVLSWF